MSSSDFKVIIAGASIAGLTLANLLQKIGVDFVVLESCGTIAPQLGASIGLHPSGLRILDQLECYGEIYKSAAWADKNTIRDEHGSVLYSHRIGQIVKERHGYPTIFLERRTAIQVLYDHIRDKSKIHVNQRVSHVELLADGIRVNTATGESFHGCILVGADGIHSAIRGEMCRLADELEPGYIPPEVKDAPPTEWGCIFGISKPTGDIRASDINVTHKTRRTFASMCGQGDRPFWFYFFKLDKPHNGFPVPRFTKEDERKIVDNEGDLPVTDHVRFKDLYANVEFSTTTALPHHVFPRFYFERIMLIGDSVHKFNPLSGQGGNNAIETAAALADSLSELLKKNSKGNKPNTAQIRAAFAATQERRQRRAQTLVDASIVVQRLSAWDTPLLKFVDINLVPLLLDTESFVDETSKAVVGAPRAHSVPLPNVPHTIPYDDELHHAPKPRRASGFVRVVLYLGLLAVMVRLIVHMVAGEGMMDRLYEALKAGPSGNYGTEHQIPLSFDHVPLIGKMLTGVVSNYFPATEMWHLDFRLLTFYLSISEFVVFAIWLLESSRARSQKVYSPTRWALPYGIISHMSAIGIGAPLFFLLDTAVTGSPASFWPTATHVSPHVARAILPTLVLGMLIPTLFMFAPFLDSVVRQYVLVGWCFFPGALSILHGLFTSLFLRRSSRNPPPDLRTARTTSLTHVRSLFAFSFALSALSHALTLGVALRSREASLSSVFLFRHGDMLSPFAENHNAFLVDYYVTLASCVVWAVGCVRDLERNGLVARVNWVGVFCTVVVGCVVCGPAAVVSALCWWRERVLARWPKSKEE